MPFALAVFLLVISYHASAFMLNAGPRVLVRRLQTHSVDDFGFPRRDVRDDGPSRQTPPSNGSIYSEEELQSLLNIHNQLKDRTSRSVQDNAAVPPSLHDAVLATLRDIESEGNEVSTRSAAPLAFEIDPPSVATTGYAVTAKMRATLPGIAMIASDVDGTLLTAAQGLHPRTERAVARAVAAARDPVEPLRHFVLATGKSRAGALHSLGPRTAALLAGTPGVFLQGLYCVDASGAVVFERRLAPAAVRDALLLAAELGTSLFCYDGDTIRASPASAPEHVAEFRDRWGEPEPHRAPDDDALVGDPAGFHKLLLMDYDTGKIRRLRPRLEALAAAHGCVVTQAIDTMLELLPPDSNKAVGVRMLCEALGVPTANLLAIGDGENDVEFLEQAGFSVAVGNAVPVAREVADIVLQESNSDGGAGIAIELFGLGDIFDYE